MQQQQKKAERKEEKESKSICILSMQLISVVTETNSQQLPTNLNVTYAYKFA